MEKKKISCLYQESNPATSVIQPIVVIILTELSQLSLLVCTCLNHLSGNKASKFLTKGIMFSVLAPSFYRRYLDLHEMCAGLCGAYLDIPIYNYSTINIKHNLFENILLGQNCLMRHNSNDILQQRC
jgi:hypothetical protein